MFGQLLRGASGALRLAEIRINDPTARFHCNASECQGRRAAAIRY